MCECYIYSYTKIDIWTLRSNNPFCIVQQDCLQTEMSADESFYRGDNFYIARTIISQSEPEGGVAIVGFKGQPLTSTPPAEIFFTRSQITVGESNAPLLPPTGRGYQHASRNYNGDLSFSFQNNGFISFPINFKL